MKSDANKIKDIEACIGHFKSTFFERPLMLGTPYEVNSMFFFIDKIEVVASGYETDNHFEISWVEFLVSKKLIVGADDKLRSRLKEDDHDFSELQKLRKEFFEWRKKKIGF